ncbi:hypothetical protein NE236_02910 [Actinoallomurus purpureus]|uniref:hypothetical protein n=1 Tax=Actinoallomurus purpureus TaxID=478114 RepID=UPI002091F989|nr:hypothetical protein [Actinoallomurus purpureus]MCO6003920.1 hypothetical protein [Actinoallomurus purpureus]
MPHQFLFAAGVEATRQYVANSDHPQRDLLAEDLRKLADATDEHVEHLIAARRFYYTEALAELDEPATVAPGSAANDTTGRP